MLYKEVVEIEKKSREKLEKMVKGIYKNDGEQVSYNNVMEVLDSIENKGYWENYDKTLKIVPVTQENEYDYSCDDEEELKEMKENYKNSIVKIDALNITVKDTVIIDYRLEGTSNLFDVVTAEEGASLVGVTEGAIRKAMASGRLKLGEDYRKAGRITLLNKNSLFKIFANKNK